MAERYLNIWLMLYPGKMHAWQIIRGVSSIAREKRWILSVHEPHHYDKHDYEKVPCDGVIGVLQRPDERAVFRRRGIPVVNVSRLDPPYETVGVYVDDRACGRLAAEHFLERGFTNFAYLGHREVPYARERGLGFVEQLKASGTPHQFTWLDETVLEHFDPRQVSVQTPDAFQWLMDLPRPVGLMTSLDGYGLGAAEACHIVGLDVPQDVAILGVHNGQILCEMCTPGLSSVATPVEQMGAIAAQLLDRQLNGEKVSLEPIELPPIGVVNRASTDVVAVDDELVTRAIRHMREHASRRIDVTVVARELGVSRRHLERRFRAKLGRTPLQELQRMRIRLALSRLATTHESIGEIAFHCGYSRADQFARAVRDVTGLSPTQYRAQFLGLYNHGPRA